MIHKVKSHMQAFVRWSFGCQVSVIRSFHVAAVLLVILTKEAWWNVAVSSLVWLANSEL